MDTTCMEDVATMIRMEYLEMPDMKLTSCQVRRLLALPAEVCEAALESLVRSGFLARTSDGALLRSAWAA